MLYLQYLIIPQIDTEANSGAHETVPLQPVSPYPVQQYQPYPVQQYPEGQQPPVAAYPTQGYIQGQQPPMPGYPGQPVGPYAVQAYTNVPQFQVQPVAHYQPRPIPWYKTNWCKITAVVIVILIILRVAWYLFTLFLHGVFSFSGNAFLESLNITGREVDSIYKDYEYDEVTTLEP